MSDTTEYSGGCHCKNIKFRMELSQPLSSYHPRVCNCHFCRKHQASYLSDPDGMLKIIINDETNMSRYQQGSKMADFLICRLCGVFVAVCHLEPGQLYAAVNTNAINVETSFDSKVDISTTQLSDKHRVLRWKSLWFPKVTITYCD